jgi:hypothetical protein
MVTVRRDAVFCQYLLHPCVVEAIVRMFLDDGLSWQRRQLLGDLGAPAATERTYRESPNTANAGESGSRRD